MGQPQYLIDTNVVIDYLAGKLPAAGMAFVDGVINDRPQLSVITKIELLGYPLIGAPAQVLIDFVNDSDVLQLTEDVADRCIVLWKAHKIKLPDALIAATALVNNLTLLTRNTTDFKNISGLRVINPYDL